MTVFASGKTGTIGKWLPAHIRPVSFRIEEVSKENLSLEKNDVYIHLAGIVGNSNVLADKERSRRINIDGTIELAEMSIEKEISKFVFISTSHVYQRSNKALSEDSELSPINLYAEHKLEAEEKLKNLFLGATTKLLILRLFSILDFNTAEYTLGGALTRLQSGQKFFIPFGDDLRDFLTPKQAAQEISEIAENETITGTLNLCTGTPISVYEAAVLMSAGSEGANLGDFVSKGNSETPSIIGNSDRLKKLTGKSLNWAYRQT